MSAISQLLRVWFEIWMSSDLSIYLLTWRVWTNTVSFQLWKRSATCHIRMTQIGVSFANRYLPAKNGWADNRKIQCAINTHLRAFFSPGLSGIPSHCLIRPVSLCSFLMMEWIHNMLALYNRHDIFSHIDHFLVWNVGPSFSNVQRSNPLSHYFPNGIRFFPH